MMPKIHRKYRNHRKHRTNKKRRSEFISPLNYHNWRLLVDKLAKRRHGVEMSTIFKLCTILLLRSSDALKLRTNQVFTQNGTVKKYIQTHDQKTGKLNTLLLNKCSNILLSYRQWRINQGIHSVYLFPAITNPYKPLSRIYYNQMVVSTAKWLGLKHVGTHSARKTGARYIYHITGNVALVMSLLNQSSERVTERYLGIKGKPETKALQLLSKTFDQ